MRKKILCCILFCMCLFCEAQQNSTYIDWRDLGNIDFEKKYLPEGQRNILFPKFPPVLQALNKTTVEVKGYIVPVDKEGKFIALSANPYASCFFCGNAGPASVMTVQLKTPNKKYRIDQFRKFRGTLRLNATDIREFYYVLENAIEIGR